jgi:ubiquinone/menaquinone biosynthesis C-methylase UbiE
MKKVNTSFGKFAEVWDAKTGDKGTSSNPLTLKALLAGIGSVKGKNIYEVATGNGFLARNFARGGAKEVWASDVAPEMIDIAKSKYDQMEIKYFVRDGANITKFPKNHFDLVVINQGVFYIKDLDALFAGINKILKPGGQVVFTITHPLFTMARLDMDGYASLGKKVNVMEIYKHYLRPHPHLIKRTWEVGGKEIPVEYHFYNRPLNSYFNALGKNQLFVSEIFEPKSAMKVKGKKLKSDIPGNLVIKAVKV